MLAATENRSRNPFITGGIVIGLLLLFLLGIHGLGDGFKLLGRDLLDAFFRATSNPIVALMVGLLATTLVQSSSVTTSMIVGLVAAPENPLPVAIGRNRGNAIDDQAVVAVGARRVEQGHRRPLGGVGCTALADRRGQDIAIPLHGSLHGMRPNVIRDGQEIGDVSALLEGGA